MIRLALLLALALTAPVAAQSAEDFYHDAARLYIAEDDDAAERAALEGLALVPDDPKLRALLDKIRERSEQQQSGQGDQDERDDADDQESGYGSTPQDEGSSGPPQHSDEGEPDDQQPGGDRTPNGQQPEEEEPAEPDGEREGEAGAEDNQSDGDAQHGDGTASPYDLKPGTMSRAEAERVLRALQADEVELLREVQRRRTRPRYVEKDW